MADATTDQKNTLRPICFMIMPYGKKQTMSDKGPATIDYNALWDKALYSFIEEDLDYHAIRADQDMSALIIKEMIERLALSDLVIADVSTPNTNVYYEIGVRHAAQRTGCVMISATWAQQTFDITQMRQVRYPLPEGEITDDTAQAVRDALNRSVKGLIDGTSPVFDSITGYPGKPDESLVSSMRGQLLQLSQFTADARVARMQPKDKREVALNALIDKYKSIIPKLPGVAVEILTSLRDCAQWQSVIDYVNNLSGVTKNLPVVQEIYNLAISKTGKHIEAIAALQELMKLNGETSERWGLIGGRYKKLYDETKDPRYLSASITAYDTGMRKDLNDYFPSNNLPLLYRTRGRKGDEDNANIAATVALMACERSRTNNPSDPWAVPTLTVMAFASGNADKAEDLYNEMADNGTEPFNLQSTIPELQRAIDLTRDKDVASNLNAILDKIKALQD
jgi:tetratricopeptide repeat protein